MKTKRVFLGRRPGSARQPGRLGLALLLLCAHLGALPAQAVVAGSELPPKLPFKRSAGSGLAAGTQQTQETESVLIAGRQFRVGMSLAEALQKIPPEHAVTEGPPGFFTVWRGGGSQAEDELGTFCVYDGSLVSAHAVRANSAYSDVREIILQLNLALADLSRGGCLRPEVLTNQSKMLDGSDEPVEFTVTAFRCGRKSVAVAMRLSRGQTDVHVTESVDRQ